jgi:hypothetical protein
MRPLTLDDIMPLSEFAGRRRELFHAFDRYLDRYRRVRVGPQATLVFENRQTLWFRVQDLLRVARLAEPARVEEELNLYNRLLPDRDHLQAALVIGETEGSEPAEEPAQWQALRGEDVRLHLGQRSVSARLITCRPEDRADGTADWLQFTIAGDDRRSFANFRVPALFGIHLPTYSHESPALSEDIRQSLLDDLNLSDRDDIARGMINS